METGDLCLASHPFGAVIERNSPGDMASCIGSCRERFERELKRGRYCGKMIIVVSGSFEDVLKAGRGLHVNAIIGSVASWVLRYAPFIFAGSEHLAGFLSV